MTYVAILIDLASVRRDLNLFTVTQWNRVEGRPRTRQFDGRCAPRYATRRG